MSDKTCSLCLWWSVPKGALEQYAHRAMGSCRKGGPDPDQGSSDTAAHESCDKWDEMPHA